MYRQIGNPYVVPITREVAKEWAESLAWEGEREFGNARAAYLLSEYESERLYSPVWARARWNGKWYRMNGQHSSMVLHQLNGNFPRSMCAIVLDFDCDSKSDMIALFSTFDTRTSARQGKDYAGIVMAVHEEFNNSDVQRGSAYKLASGIFFAHNNGEHRLKASERERAQLISESPQFVIDATVFANMKGCTTGICAAMYRTWQRGNPRWEPFWQSVFYETDPNSDSPSRTLARYLRGEGASNSKRRARSDFVRALHAWNAFIEGRVTSLSYYKDKPVPPVRG